ncbi:MAG: nucleotide exchange factor GrpE [Candidatus Wallbacteria bacterium]|nr:nucleotide exchange factor GrpE [Candidatus Wallbacteria bacterium]
MEESMLGQEPKVNSDFYKKLQQQIVQKENIIKLLQLKVKNLEEDRGGPAADDDGGLPRRFEGYEKKLKAHEKTERELQEDNEALSRRAAKSEEMLAEQQERYAALSAELEKRAEELGRLRGNLSPGDDKKLDKLWGEVRALETKLGRKDEELARLRQELAEAGPGADAARGLRDLREQFERLQAEKTHLEQTVAQLKEHGPGKDGLLGDELARKDDELRVAEREHQRLKDEADRLKTRLDEARAHAESASPTGSFQLVQAIITLFQKLQDLKDRLGPQKEYAAIETSLREISGLIGLERIKSVGRAVDPELHQVVEIVYSTEHPHNSVIRESAQGYTARASVVKMAEVVVARNPYWCRKCERVAAEGSRYCNFCGEKVVGRESPDVKVLDPSLTLKSFLDLAKAKEDAADFDAAEKAYQQVLTLDSANAAALWGVVQVREASGRYRDALSGLDPLAAQPVIPEDIDRVRLRLRTKMEIVQRLQSLV